MSTFVAGEPVLFLTNKARERGWTDEVRRAVAGPLFHPRLAFTVSTLLRRGNPFDIDNTAKLVLETVSPAPASVWVTLMPGAPAGVAIDDVLPPRPEISALDVYVVAPPPRSFRGTQLPELTSAIVLEPATAPIGLELTFDSSEARIGQFAFDGPIKPLIDALGPLFGRYAYGPADHRVRELRITKGAHPDRSGVRVRAWLL